MTRFSHPRAAGLDPPSVNVTILVVLTPTEGSYSDAQVTDSYLVGQKSTD